MERSIPSPPKNPESEMFWDAANRHELLLGKCIECREVHYPPRAICPHCFSAGATTVKAVGRGSLYSFSVMQHAKPPYVIAYVTLEEGISVLTNIVDCDFDGLEIGDSVHLAFVKADDGQAIPMFSPAGV